MTDKKISELTSNGTLTGSELVELVQSGSNVNALLSAIKTFITTGYLTSTTASSTYATIANQRYQFLNDSTTTLTTYTVPASAVTENGRTIIELSNNSLTSITVDTNTGAGKTSGDSVTINITGTYAAQTLVADGVTLNGTLAFSANAKIKTLIYRGSNVWTVLGG